MKIMKTELLSILPPKLRPRIRDELLSELQEIRLRLNRPAKLVCSGVNQTLTHVVSEEDLRYCINAASRYSPWNSATVRDGYLTAPGGHRIGLCGEAAGDSIHQITSLCIRVAKDVPGIAVGIPLTESTLILGPPGSGKTTLLRALIRRLSEAGRGSVAVVDERAEIFPLSGGHTCFEPGENTDVLTGRRKADGIEMVLRTMGPGWIAVDEITAEEDCRALIRAGWCGVKLAATAHASSLSDLRSREIYRPLVQTGLFRQAIILHMDKSWHRERI